MLRAGLIDQRVRNLWLTSNTMATAASEKASALAQSRSLLAELISSVANGSGEQRSRILERVTDLFSVGSRSYSHDQIALFDDVLQKLSADIEVKARAKLADQLADLDTAPPKLIRSLAFDDEIDVAGPVLARSPQLTDD